MDCLGKGLGGQGISQNEPGGTQGGPGISQGAPEMLQNESGISQELCLSVSLPVCLPACLPALASFRVEPALMFFGMVVMVCPSCSVVTICKLARRC